MKAQNGAAAAGREPRGSPAEPSLPLLLPPLRPPALGSQEGLTNLSLHLISPLPTSTFHPLSLFFWANL